MSRSEPYYTEIVDTPAVLLTNSKHPTVKSPGNLSRESSESPMRPRKKNNRSRIDSRIDAPHSAQLDEQEIIKNVTKGHTFLGMATFQYAPKPVNYTNQRTSLILLKISRLPELDSATFPPHPNAKANHTLSDSVLR
jgi:hypothetical protein